MLFSMAKKKLQGDLIVALQYLKRAYNKAGDGLFIRDRSDRTWDTSFKLKRGEI